MRLSPASHHPDRPNPRHGEHSAGCSPPSSRTESQSVYYVPTDDDELLVSTMAGCSKALAVSRDPKVSLCVLDERWPFTYLQVYADATVDTDRELVDDAMTAVGERMTGRAPWPGGPPLRRGDGGAGTACRAPLPAVLDVRTTTSPPAPQRPSRTAHALNLGEPRLGRSLPVLTSAQAAEDGDSGHSQPTRLKYQRSTTTVRAMMAIASG